MAGSSFSDNSGTSTSDPTLMDNQYSQWGKQLSTLLASLGQNQYNWAMDQFNRGSGITDQNIAHYMDLAGKGAGLAQNLLSRYTDVFEPLMDEYIKQAGTYNSEARQRFKMGEAESTVGQATTAARDAAERKLQSFGVNPNSGRYQDLLMTSRIQDAAARAGAGTQASQNTAAIGRQMTEKAAQMGQNVPGMTVNALQSAYTGVTGAENAILGMLNTGANLTSSAAPFFNAASGAIKMPPTGNVSRQQNQGHSSSNTQDPGANKSGGDKGGGGNERRPSDDSYNRGSHGDAGAAGKTKPDGSDGAKTVGVPGGSAAKIMHPDYKDQGEEFGPPMPPQGEEFGPPQYNAAEDYKRSGTGDDDNGGARDPWDPATFAGGQGSPWWSDQPGGQQQDLVQPFSGDWGQAPNPQAPSGPTNDSQPFNAGPTNFDYQPPQQQQDPFAGAQNPMDQQQDMIPSNAGQVGGDFGNDYWQPQQDQQQVNNYGDQQDWGGGNQDFGGGGDQADQSADYGQDNSYNDYGGNDFGGQQPDYSNYQDESGGGGSNDYTDYGGEYAQGGKVQGRGVLPTTGGHVPSSASPSRGQQTDDIPARLNAGEFVIPRDVTAHYGTKHFQDLIEKSRRLRTGMAGAPPKPQMKPALRLRPSFVSRGM